MTSNHPPPGFLGIPAMETIPTTAVKALWQLQLPPGSTICIIDSSDPIPVKRNELVERCLADPKNQWLCMIDSDMVPPRDTIYRLWETGKDIVSGLYFQRIAPHKPLCGPGRDADDRLVFLGTIDSSGSLIEQGWCGAGCMMIRRHVLEAMPSPRFFYEDSMWDRQSTVGEDVCFCEQAIAAGYKIHVLTTLQPGHLTYHEVTIVDRCLNQSHIPPP